ncbi:MAG: DUF1080 domain-containing protein [Pirellulales bacterium]|nr:DUF1080 domain-containing protein [Pirellulales bacterium]
MIHAVKLVIAAALAVFSFVPLSSAEEEAKPVPRPDTKPISLFDGKTLGGWKKSDFGGKGTVEVSKGQLILGDDDGLNGVTWTKEFPKVNYEIELDAMRVAGADFFCGLTFPYKKSFCSFIVGGWGGTVVGLSSVDSYDASENNTSEFAEFKNGKWYHIRLRVTDDKIEAWIDKKKYVDFETKDRKLSVRIDIEAATPLGLSCWSTKAAMRNIEYRPIKKEK